MNVQDNLTLELPEKSQLQQELATTNQPSGSKNDIIIHNCEKTLSNNCYNNEKKEIQINENYFISDLKKETISINKKSEAFDLNKKNANKISYHKTVCELNWNEANANNSNHNIVPIQQVNKIINLVNSENNLDITESEGMTEEGKNGIISMCSNLFNILICVHFEIITYHIVFNYLLGLAVFRI